MIEIRYTATLITPDDTDTNVYGEPCGEGDGQTMEDGWWDPDWSMWEVWPHEEHALVEWIDQTMIDEEYGGDENRAIEEIISNRIGAIDSFDGITAYGADTIDNYITGERVIGAAHITRLEESIT